MKENDLNLTYCNETVMIAFSFNRDLERDRITKNYQKGQRISYRNDMQCLGVINI